MKNKNNLKIINIGISGFPYLKTAPVHKTVLLNKALNVAGYSTLVINNEALLSKNSNNDIPLDGVFEGIAYHYTLKTPYKPTSPIRKKTLKYLGKLNEFFFLIKNKIKNGTDICIFFTNGSFLNLMYYRFLSFLLNFKFIIVYHEYRSDFAPRQKKLFLKINDKLFDRYFINFVDGILPISEFLISHIKSINDKKPLLKIPPLIDFNLYDKSKLSNESFFLYCGSIVYEDVIKFIISAFELINIPNDFSLYLVVGGGQKQLRNLEQFVGKSPKKDYIKLFSDLSFDYLISLYTDARALLIPLKPDIRDTARSPQKLAEYVASGNPVVSTNYGEVEHYFKDGENALIADKYDLALFLEKLEFVIENPERAKEIGIAGNQIGKEHFDYLQYVDKLKKFLTNLN